MHIATVAQEDLLEKKIFRIFFAVAIGVHFVVLSFQYAQLFRHPMTLEDEVDVELMMDLDKTPARDTALPEAVKKPQESIPANVLPQLPKKFSIEQPDAPKEEFVEEKDPKKLSEDAEQKVEKSSTEEAPPMPEEDNKIKKEDALKRLAVEKLRQQDKKSEQYQSPKTDAIARLKEELSKEDGKGGALGTSLTGARTSQYRSLLQAAIRRNYVLPETFNFSSGNLKVVLALMITAQGDLSQVKVEESSGNESFDAMALKAVQDSAPLPKPPEELAGATILLNFVP